MVKNNIFLNAEYHHIKTDTTYQTLILSNSDKPQQIVYVNEKGEIWSKNVERFLQGMSFIEQKSDNNYTKKDIPAHYPQRGDFYYNKETDSTLKAAPAASVLYVTNVYADKSDYPKTVFFLSDGIIDYLSLEDFIKVFQK